MPQSRARIATPTNDLKCRLRADRRREQRHTIALPVKATGFNAIEGHWSEVAETVNITPGGMAIRLLRKVMIGDVIYVEVPLTPRMRKPADSSPTYESYAVVRYLQIGSNGRQIVRLQFVQNPGAS
jgi:hypothetical protein